MRAAPFKHIDEYPLAGQGKAEFETSVLNHPLAVGIKKNVLHAMLRISKGRCDFKASAKTISRRIGTTEATAAYCINELTAEAGPIAVVVDRDVRARRRFLFKQHRNFRSACITLAERGVIRFDSPWLEGWDQARLDSATRRTARVERDIYRKAGCVSYSYIPPTGF